jgi:predicted dehydrogenase
MAPIATRRDLLKAGGVMAVGSALTRRANLFGEDERKIRVGFVGVGNRGSGLLDIALHMPGIEVPALCDIQKPHLDQAIVMVEKAGQKRPEGYGKDEYDYRRLMDRDDLDAVIVATYWQWHTPMAVHAMKAGKYAGIEVPIGITMAELWQLVDTQEQTKVPCMMLENWSFRGENLVVLNMIRAGLFGEIIHCHCAHSHDCTDIWWFDEKGMPRWVGEYLLKRNADQYPTHSLGPVLSWMDINCGDAFDTLVSMANRSVSINDHFRRKFGPDHPMATQKIMQSDVVTSIVKTKKGNTIVINNDMQTPRPYDNRWEIEGTRGLYNEQRWSVFMDGEVPKGNDQHKWEPLQPYEKKYEHSLYRGLGDPEQRKARGMFGHGEPDYLELQEFFKAVRQETPTPIDIYDSVTMSVVIPLSEESIAKGGMPVQCPDFTRGQWKTRKPYFALDGRA